LNPTSEEIVNKRWIDDLDTCVGCMDGVTHLPNQDVGKRNSLGPWIHRLLTSFIIIMTFYMQSEINNLFVEISIMNRILRTIIQFSIIVLLLGIGHKLLRSLD
jgi:hypothetical protein